MTISLLQYVKKVSGRFSLKGYLALLCGFIFSILLTISFLGSIRYTPLFLSAVIGIVLFMIYRPYQGNWFKDWMGESRRELTFGIMFGLLFGSIRLILNYGSQSYFSTGVGIIGLCMLIALFVKCLENHRSYKNGHNDESGS